MSVVVAVRVTRVPTAVAIDIRLVGVGHQPTIVESIRDAVTVCVFDRLLVQFKRPDVRTVAACRIGYRTEVKGTAGNDYTLILDNDVASKIRCGRRLIDRRTAGEQRVRESGAAIVLQ